MLTGSEEEEALNVDWAQVKKIGDMTAENLKKLEAIWKEEHSLTAFTNEDQFKTYEELQTRLNEVLGTNKRAAVPTVDDEEYEPVAAVAAATPTPASKAVADDDDQLSYFARLAEEE